MTTFTTWLRKQRNRDDAIGDLARDALADHDGWPRGRADLDEYERHLARHGADLDVLRDAWADSWSWTWTSSSWRKTTA